MNALKEASGKWSSSRILGAVIVANILGILNWAALAGNWETVRHVSIELVLLAGALYGINRYTATKAPQ